MFTVTSAVGAPWVMTGTPTADANNTCSPSRVSPPQSRWEKEHGRLDRRRIARVAVTPEEIGLSGCWQVIAVERYSQNQNQPKEAASLEIGCYATSLAVKESDDAAVMALIRGHWSAIENGTHYRRDVTLGEDANRTANRKGAAARATFRNLANGIYAVSYTHLTLPTSDLV